MTVISYLLVIAQIILAVTEPIDEGRDVGSIKVHKGKYIVKNPGQFGYVVYLKIDSYRVERNPFRIFTETSSCGGVLLKKDVILTAAHCTGDADTRPKISAWLGILDTELEKGKGQEILVKGFTVHHDFIQNINDIALLWLWQPVQLDVKYIELAKLPTEDFNAVGRRGWIVGWGCSSCGKDTTMLQKALVRGVSFENCQDYYKHTKIVSTFICIMADNKKATSTLGDSGGPFVIQGMVVGISSFGAVDWSRSDASKGISVSDAKKPAAYTYLTKYLDWIHNTLEEEPKVKLLGPPPTGQPPTIPPSSTRKPPSPNSSRKPSQSSPLLNRKLHLPGPSRMPPKGPPPKILKGRTHNL